MQSSALKHWILKRFMVSGYVKMVNEIPQAGRRDVWDLMYHNKAAVLGIARPITENRYLYQSGIFVITTTRLIGIKN